MASDTAVSVWLCAHTAPLFPVRLFQYSTVGQPLSFSLCLIYWTVYCSNCNPFSTGIRASSNSAWCWLELASLNLLTDIYPHPQCCSESAKTEHLLCPLDPWNSSSWEIGSNFDHQISFSFMYLSSPCCWVLDKWVTPNDQTVLSSTEQKFGA